MRWFARLFLILILVLALAMGMLFVPQTRVFMVEQILLRVDQVVSIEYDGIQSSSLGQWYFSELTIYLHKQPWIKCRELFLDVQMASLLEKKITINKFTVQELNWYQPEQGFPARRDENSSDASQDIPSWAVDLKMFNIAKLKLDLSVLEIPKTLQQTAFSVSGDAQVFDSTDLLKINLQIDGLDNTLRTSVRTEVNSEKNVKVHGTLSEASGGVLGALIHFPVEQALDLGFSLSLQSNENAHLIQLEEFSSKINGFMLDMQAEVAVDKALTMLNLKSATLRTRAEDEIRSSNQSGERQHTFAGKITKKDVDLQAGLNYFPLELLAPWVDGLGGGFVDMQARVFGEWAAPALDAQLKAELNVDKPYPLEKLRLIADVYYDWKELRLARFSVEEVQGGAASIGASGDWKLHEKQIDMQVEAVNIEEKYITFLRQYLPELPDTMQAIQIDKIDVLKAHVQGSTFNNFQQARIALQTRLSGSYMDHPVSVDGNIEGTTDKINISELRVEMDDANFILSGMVDRSGALNNLQLQADNVPLAYLREFEIALPEGLDGKIDAEVALQKSLAQPELDFTLESVLEYPLLNTSGEKTLERLRLLSEGNWQKSSLNLDQLELLWLREDKKPVPLLLAKTNIVFADHNKKISLTASTNKFPMSLLSTYGWPDEKGVLDFELQVNSSMTDQANGDWLDELGAGGHLKYLTQQNDRKSGTPVDLEFNVDINNEINPDTGKSWWLARFSMNKGEQSSRSLQVRGQSGSLVQFIEDPSRLPSLEISGDVDFSFFDFLLTKAQHFGGLLQVDLNVGGEIRRPDIEGKLVLVNGRYAHDHYGIRLQEIGAEAEFSGQKMLLKSLSASDMGSGKLSSEGYIDWENLTAMEPEQKRGDISLILKAHNFESLRHEQVEGKLDADINVVGDFNRLLLKGDIEVSPFSASIAQNPGPVVPELNYEFSKEEELQEAKALFAFPELVLDLHVNVDKQAYIRGRGLEAELAGSIALLGPTDAVEYKGEFKTVRGQFMVMGRRFVLEKGEVGFSNNALALYVLGVYEESGLKVKAELRGANEKFTLSMTSEPSMPEDELLAKLIFGRSVEDMTAIQAVQLAQAVKTLQGGGGFDPIEKARDVLNVDTIKVNTEETDEGQAVSLGAGKYITDKVYLELERSSDPANPWQGNVRIELTPHIGLESTTGGTTGGSAEILWKYDY